MSIVFDVLQEELDRLKNLYKIYTKKIQVLPKGSISLKKRYNNIYLYLAFRNGYKVKFKYIGKKDSQAASAIAEKVKQRKELEMKIKKIRQEIKRLQKAIHYGQEK